ncbi:hypothetical protein PHMEG_0004780 [Phytophthora megakarya]|uniref:Uncharacterized protein n=1 Tax=Phytophthora megakarya TaxID=4795 RepID=A0A225WSZ9_9STRA|nr:hypothetical protein PHMEG_0004780 [Phytophthora megakarya]
MTTSQPTITTKGPNHHCYDRMDSNNIDFEILQQRLIYGAALGASTITYDFQISINKTTLWTSKTSKRLTSRVVSRSTSEVPHKRYSQFEEVKQPKMGEDTHDQTTV